jgi:hypothetical protein
MKYLKIILNPIKVKGDEDDQETLQQDIYEKLSAMIEAETLLWKIDDEEEDDDEDY